MEINGDLWVDRVRINEIKCIQCGECVRACMEENKDIHAMTNIVGQKLHAVSSETPIPSPTLLQNILQMEQAEQGTFWKDQFKKCIKCYGCIDMCPVFLDWEEELDITKWVKRGEVPPPYPLFHLLRAYNVWDTCVGCGECERTCPADIPLKSVQDMIRYLTPEKVFETIPGLEKEAQEDRLMVSGDAERMNSDSPGMTDDQNAITDLKSLVQTLIEKVAHIEQGAATQRGELLARKALLEAGLPESMTKYIPLDDESRIMDQVETLKKEILNIRQAENDGKLLDSTIPSIGGNTGTLGEDAALQFAQSLNAGDSEIGIISEQA